MSRLGDFENSIVERLGTAQIGATAAFRTVEGASGGRRPWNREALARERMPAAYVAFLEEPTAPETRAILRGPRFAVLIGSRSSRLVSDPRHGDSGSAGAFALIDAARGVLDGFEIDGGLELVCLQVRFVEADERSVVYELVYRIGAIVEDVPSAGLTFDGSAIQGALSRMSMEVGPQNAEVLEYVHHEGRAVYRISLESGSRIVRWMGELRAESQSGLSAVEEGIESAIGSLASATIEEAGVHTLTGCTITWLVRKGPRLVRGGLVAQPAEIVFVQKL
ncbi:MAG: DUF1834 family protein [Phycisphaerae bacterium]|nr:DUF1834 family protein [Phycisphaerae bacterium]